MKIFNPLTGQMEDDAQTTPAAPPQQTMTQAPSPLVPAAPSQPAKPMAEQPPQTDFPAVSVQTPPMTPIATEQTTVTTKQTIPTAQENALLKDMNNLTKEEINLQKEKGTLEVQLAQSKAEAAAKAEQIRAEQQLALEEKQKQDREREAADQKELEDARSEAKNFKFQDYWADRSTGNKILAAFSIGLGALGSGLTGSNQNQALEIINKAIDRDYNMQKDNLAQLRANVAESKDKLQTNKQIANEADARLSALYSGKLQSVADSLATRAANLGIPAAQIESNSVINEIKKKSNEYMLKAEESKRTIRETQKVDSVKMPEAPKEATEGQAKARAFASRMVEATKIYDELGGISPEASQKILEHQKENMVLQQQNVPGIGVITKYFLKPGVDSIPKGISEKDKRAYLALEEFARANLRKESGAAIGVDEMQQELNQYLPRPGEGTDTIKQRRGMMTSKLAALQQEVGKGATINIPKEPKREAQKKELTPQEKAALDWANNNPENPKAKEIKKELGL